MRSWREELYDGGLRRFEASIATLQLVDVARRRLADALGVPGGTLPMVHRRWSAEALYAALEPARGALAGWQAIRSWSAAWLVGLGERVEDWVMDPPRLRVIAPGAGALPAAAPAYFAHRDTWYANPRCQLNVWMPLFEVGPNDGFRVYLDAFGQPVANDSSRFNWASWRLGGWQAPGPPLRPYPRLLGPEPAGHHVDVSGESAFFMVFSAAHLHRTLPRPPEAAHSRISIDFRLVHRGDHRAGRGAPDPDNQSQGDTSALYQPLTG